VSTVNVLHLYLGDSNFISGLEVRHPRCVVESQEQVIGTYVCSQKHNYEGHLESKERFAIKNIY